MEVHYLLANAIVVVAGLHAVAALFHHFFMKDGVLKAMLPGLRADGGRDDDGRRVARQRYA